MPIRKWVLFPRRTPEVVKHDLPYDITLGEDCQRLTVGREFLVGEDERSFSIDMCSRIFYSKKISVWGI